MNTIARLGIQIDQDRLDYETTSHEGDFESLSFFANEVIPELRVQTLHN